MIYYYLLLLTLCLLPTPDATVCIDVNILYEIYT